MIDSIDIEELKNRMSDVLAYVQTENDELVIMVGDRGVAVIRPFYATDQLYLDRADRERSICGMAGREDSKSPLDRPPSSWEGKMTDIVDLDHLFGENR